MHPYAKVVNNTVVERRNFPEPLEPDMIKLLNSKPVWRPLLTENETYDPATQARTGPVEIIEPERVIDRYAVTSRSRTDIEADKTEEIRAEAERRIAEGFELQPGVRFRCDTTSIARIQGLKDAPAAAFPIQFKTSAGITVTVSNQPEAQAIFDAATLFVAMILAKSAVQQDGLANLSDADLVAFNSTANQHWSS